VPRTSRITRRRKPTDKRSTPSRDTTGRDAAPARPPAGAKPRGGIRRAPGPQNETKPAAQSAVAREPAARPAKPQRQPDEGYVAVGRVLSPFGLKGELRVQSLTDNPRRFAPRSKLFAGQAPVTVLTSREAQGFFYVTFKGFPDRTSVEKFRHALLQVPETDLPPLAEGEYYRFQILGLRVVGVDGAEIGVIEEVLETGANDVYRIRTTDGGELLLPALVDVIISIDLAKQEMVVDPPAWR